MSCTAREIAEKKRQAQEKLMQKQEKLMETSSTTNIFHQKSPTGTAQLFYGNTTKNQKTKELSFETNVKPHNQYTHKNRILSQPYSNRADNSKDVSNTEKKNARVYKKTITCTCAMISEDRFEVIPSSYHAQLIEVFKAITTRKYDNNSKIWSFDLKEYEKLQEKVLHLKPDVVIGCLPQFVIRLLQEPRAIPSSLVLNSIEPKLRDSLLEFQRDGVCFGIEKQGRCMIADDMGLGKTYQALAIADFYKNDWPLLICTMAATRDTWAKEIRHLLPSIPDQYITVLTATTDYFGDAKVLIVSYPLMEKNCDRLQQKNFGCLILDESHTLKNFKTKSASAANRLAQKAKRVILLTGTPALSRPVELFTQLQMLDKNFFSFKEYSQRYCAARQTTFGWDASGQSNLNELDIILKLKFMIRRTKEQIEFEMGEKSRETIQLDPEIIWKVQEDGMRETLENIKEYSSDIMKLQGKQREEILLKLYAETARIKSRAVCSYIKGIIENNPKFIVFAHHKHMLNAITECLKKLNVNYIRIDGTTRNDLRTKYINTFQSNENCRAAILSLKACNAGITLTAAKIVIFAELDWNPSTLAQAESRAHRIGQEDHVICRYLLASGTADDYIWPMIQRKQNILSKAGLFSEDLSNAVHSTVDIPECGLSTQHSPIPSKKIDLSSNKENTNTLKTESNNDLHNMLNDGNDEVLLDLDF